MSYIIQFAFLQNYLRKNDDFAKLCQVSLESYTSCVEPLSWNLNSVQKSKYLEDHVTKTYTCRATQYDMEKVLISGSVIQKQNKNEHHKNILRTIKYDKEVQVSEAPTDDAKSINTNEMEENKIGTCEKLLSENKALLFEIEHLKNLLEENKNAKQWPDWTIGVLEERIILHQLVKKIVKFEPKITELRKRALKSKKLMTERDNLITRIRELSIELLRNKYLKSKCRSYRNDRVNLIDRIYSLENSLNKITDLFKKIFDGFKILRDYLNQQFDDQETKFEGYNKVIYAIHRNKEETTDANNILREDSISYIKKIQSSENEIISLQQQIDCLKKTMEDTNLNKTKVEDNYIEIIEKPEYKQVNPFANVNIDLELDEPKNLELNKDDSCVKEKTINSLLQNTILELEYNLEQEKICNNILNNKMETTKNKYDDMFNKKHQCDEVLKDLMNRFELQSNEIITNFNRNIETLLTTDSNDKVSSISNNLMINNLSIDNGKNYFVENSETIQNITTNNLMTKDEKYEIEINKMKVFYENQLQEILKNHNNEAKSLKLANESLRISLGNVKEVIGVDSIASLILKSGTEGLRKILEVIKPDFCKSISDPDNSSEIQHNLKLNEICLVIILKGINSLSNEDLKYIHTEICKAGLEKSLGVLLEPNEKIRRKCCVCNEYVCSIPQLPTDKEKTIFNKIIQLEQEIENCVEYMKKFQQPYSNIKIGRSMPSYQINNKVNKMIKQARA